MTEHTGPTVLAKDGLRAINCEQCGFIHLDPLPTQEALDELYSTDYYQIYHADLFRKEKREQWYWRLVYRERMREFERMVKGMSFPGIYIKRMLLDYGSGLGWFVKAVGAISPFFHSPIAPRWVIRGYEPSGCETVSSAVLDFIVPAEREKQRGYYGVHCSLVLEHIRDPLATLRKSYDLLVPGGVLCVVVPNEFNPLQKRLMGRGRYTPLHPHHVNYFTPASLRQLVQKAGFEIVRTTATFPIEALALAGLDYTRWKWAGPIAHYLRMVSEAALLLIAPRFKRRLFEWFASKGIGREVELWARKRA